jgi:hypothetical protein
MIDGIDDGMISSPYILTLSPTTLGHTNRRTVQDASSGKHGRRRRLCQPRWQIMRRRGHRSTKSIMPAGFRGGGGKYASAINRVQGSVEKGSSRELRSCLERAQLHCIQYCVCSSAFVALMLVWCTESCHEKRMRRRDTK